MLELLNKAPQREKEDLFHLVYNCSLYVFDYCRVLRKSIYGLLCIRYLKEILIAMESNIVLLKSKYLEWRVKVYIGRRSLSKRDHSDLRRERQSHFGPRAVHGLQGNHQETERSGGHGPACSRVL